MIVCTKIHLVQLLKGRAYKTNMKFLAAVEQRKGISGRGEKEAFRTLFCMDMVPPAPQ